MAEEEGHRRQGRYNTGRWSHHCVAGVAVLALGCGRSGAGLWDRCDVAVDEAVDRRTVFVVQIMDPAEILNVRFHFGGKFIRIGPNLDYAGGDSGLPEIERDKLSLQEVKGFLRDHMTVKESMKYYFLLPGRDLADGLVFLHDDFGCIKMSDYITDGGVADIYVEYNGEEDEREETDSGSDFEDELDEAMNMGSEEEPDAVITSEEPCVIMTTQEPDHILNATEHILVPDVVPIDLVANVEEVVEDMEFESSDEDYSYDEDEDGNMVRRKSQFVRFNSRSDIPHFSLGMVFKSKKQLCRAIKRYGLATKRSISFLKSEEVRVRAKCDWPGCPWMLYAAKTSRCSRFQIITFEDEHQCAQNRDNKLVTAKVIAKNLVLLNELHIRRSISSTGEVREEQRCDTASSASCAQRKPPVPSRPCGRAPTPPRAQETPPQPALATSKPRTHGPPTHCASPPTPKAPEQEDMDTHTPPGSDGDAAAGEGEGEGKESLENPLVSMECFIFL
ncbi:hypothetical protein D1007_00595 [Hordeum vulgare]|nr:hypothetical protein D1007_00595 [Hordeum vulgare]